MVDAGVIPLDRVRRRLRALGKIDAHQIADALSLLSAALLERQLDPEAEAVGDCVAKLREISKLRVHVARRGG